MSYGDACLYPGISQIIHCLFWAPHSRLLPSLLQNVSLYTIVTHLYYLHLLDWTITLPCPRIKVQVKRKLKGMCDISWVFHSHLPTSSYMTHFYSSLLIPTWYSYQYLAEVGKSIIIFNVCSRQPLRMDLSDLHLLIFMPLCNPLPLVWAAPTALLLADLQWQM